MQLLSFQKSCGWGLVGATLSGLLALGHATPAAAQYYYQPSPDYYHNDTASGTFMGGAFGAVTGAILGGKSDRGEGALIGAGVGALTGNLLGRAKDQTDQRQAATGAAVAAQANQQAAAVAVTNYDLVTMTQAGVSEDLIISTMRSRGARLDLSPAALIALKQSGVSDRVVLAAQQSTGHGYAPAAVPVVTEVVRPTVILAAPPRRYYHYDPWYHHHYHHHHAPRARLHYSIGF